MCDSIDSAFAAIRQLVDGWFWTPGWGNVATVTVALVAVAINAVSLRRSAKQFRQNRLDANDDKLRSAIAAFIAAAGIRINMSEGAVTDPLGLCDEAEYRRRAESYLPELIANTRVMHEKNWTVALLCHDKLIAIPAMKMISALSADEMAWVAIANRQLNADVMGEVQKINDALVRAKEAEQELVNYAGPRLVLKDDV